jgi:hypothetical protein
MIGLELGTVPRFARFSFAPETRLEEIVPELKAKWALGDLETEFMLMDPDGNHRYVSPQTTLGSIDHDTDALMLRPAGTVSSPDLIVASLRESDHPSSTSAPFSPFCDDPEPENDNEIRIRFKIEQRAQEVRLLFSKTDKVAAARIKVAARLNVNPAAITLLFAGKALKDTFILDRLRVGEQGINVYIMEETEVLLLTAKANRRPG